MTKIIRLFSYCLAGWAGIMYCASAAPIFNPDNGHYYLQVTGVNVNWDGANTAASLLSFAGGMGYLATITSAAEQVFIEWNVTFTGIGFGIYIGGFQPPGSPEPGGNFQWVTGEPFIFTNWSTFEPNNTFGTEDVIELSDAGFGLWNDITRTEIRQSYLVEFTPAAVPEPSSLALLGLGSFGLFGSAWRRSTTASRSLSSLRCNAR